MRYQPKPLRFARFSPEEMQARARALREHMAARRTVRHFSSEPIPEGILEDAIAIAASAPSGANQQPWTFVIVRDDALKQRVRDAAEQEERVSYGGRMSEEWLRELEHLGTNWEKPHITEAPALIVPFEQVWGYDEHGGRRKHYYAGESIGIAVGFLLAALHYAGLATLTHTPSPMKFLREELGRPDNERPFVLIPVGYPADGAEVPDIARKPLAQVLVNL
ncbi:MAG: nitroreductase family protein [Kofleriaceae bacterium]